MRATANPIACVCGIAILCGLAGRVEAVAQTSSPATAAADELLQAIRSGDEAQRQALIETRFTRELRAHVSMEEHLRMLAGWERSLVGMEVEGVLELGATEARLILEGTDRLVELRVVVEPDPPHGIAGIEVGAAGPPLGAELNARTLEEVERELERLAEEDRFSGVVLVATPDRVLYRSAHGPSDREEGRPIRPETRFDIGSIYKLFTSTAILRLVQDGHLALADPLGTHLDGFDAPVAERVTAEHLLRHRSGLGDYLSHPAFEADPKRFRRPADYLPLARRQELAFEPGTRGRYSNMGFVLLGAIIESVTGRDFHEVVDELVFLPAGMATAGPAGGPDAARRYHHMPDGWLRVDAEYPDIASPAGGGFATATDLQRFVEALLDHRLLDAEHTALLLNDFEQPVDATALPPVFGFAGGADGVAAALMARPAERTTVVVLANVDAFPVETLARYVLELAGR